MIEVQTPRGSVINVQTGSGTIRAQLQWNSDFVSRRTEQFTKVQKYVDNECLRRCDKLIPFKTGMLKKSGILGTVVGSGKIRYIAPYAGHQYYNGRSNGQRGRLWFERMKQAHKAEILRGAAQILRG
jgi:hypothetical protein